MRASPSSASAHGVDPAAAKPATPADPGSIPPAETLMHELSHDLMSPYCPGRTIASCPSPNARKLEAHILEQAEAGKSREQIETALIERFGDLRGYVGRPEILYGTALLALLAIVGLTIVARRWIRRTVAASPSLSGPAVGGAAGQAAGGAAPASSRRENDALDDALDRVDEF